MNNKSRLLAVVLMLPLPAVAGVLTVGSPSVTKGVITLEIGSSLEEDRGDQASEHIFQASYGFTDFWKSGLEFTATHEEGEQARYTVTEWKNTFVFFKQDEAMPLSLGMRVQYGFARSGDDPDNLDLRLLVQHGEGPLDLSGSAGISRGIGNHRATSVTGGFSGTIRYWGFADGQLAPGIDYLGNTGRLNNLHGFDAQRHRAGPALYGKFNKGSALDGWAFDTGYFVGLSDNAPDHSVRLNIRYSF